MPLDLDGPSLAPLSCGKAVYLVVLLHGVGANGDDLIGLALNWQPIIPQAEFIALNAPFPCDFAPDRRQWFSVADRTPEKLLQGAREAASILDPTFDDLLAKRRLEPSHLALVGFSQGAMMALYVGLRREKQIGGIVAFSGALRGVDLLRTEIRSRPPILLIHGDADDVVPYAAMAEAKAALQALSVPVKSMTRAGLGHGIDDDGVIAAGDFLTSVLSRKSADAH
jgi:phospholipase/carboxylesterase